MTYVNYLRKILRLLIYHCKIDVITSCTNDPIYLSIGLPIQKCRTSRKQFFVTFHGSGNFSMVHIKTKVNPPPYVLVLISWKINCLLIMWKKKMIKNVQSTSCRFITHHSWDGVSINLPELGSERKHKQIVKRHCTIVINPPMGGELQEFAKIWLCYWKFMGFFILLK